MASPEQSQAASVSTARNESTSLTQDEIELARFGKKQQLRRNFRFLSALALTCTVLQTWEGFLITFGIGLSNGGPAGVVYGYIIVWIGSMLQALVMAEMGSMIPVAGGQYNWVSALAPKGYNRLLSYLTGWAAFLGWQSTLAADAFLSGTMIQGLISLNYPDYEPQRWQGTLLFYAVLVVSVFTNTYLARILPGIESAVLILHVLGFFGILIAFVYLAPHASPDQIFTVFANGGGWPTQGLSFFVGLSGSMFAFIGIDTAGHIAEEIDGASRIVPQSMIWSVLIDGSLGFAIMLALLFCSGNLGDVLATDLPYSFLQSFINATNSQTGTSIMAGIIIALVIFGTIGCLTATSRMTWAFARDKGLPGYRFLDQVEPNTKLPLYSIGLSTLISLLLALINIGSTTAFNALVSLVVAAQYSCFMISAAVMLHKRITVSDAEIPWGHFKLGRFGMPVTVCALIYTVIGFFFSFWPAEPSPSLENMNWSSLIFGAFLVICVTYWVVWGRRTYTGPVEETVLGTDHAMTSFTLGKETHSVSKQTPYSVSVHQT